MDLKKSSGLIMHPTSLPSQYGIGDLGQNSRLFIDYLYETNTKIWQVLPLGPTDKVEYSPYSSPSSILGNINLLDIENLSSMPEKTFEKPNFSDSFVDYKNVYAYKEEVLRNISKDIDINEPYYQKFLEDNMIREHIVFLTLDRVNDKNWTLWDDFQKSYSEELYEYVINKHQLSFKYNLFSQYEFFQQWNILKDYANNLGINILGDIPIYVNHNSADVWSNESLFDLDSNGNMSFVSGAVPDDFTVEGQVWNTTLYNWDKNLTNNYEYWIKKLQYNLEKVDYLRIDHFVGFFQYWAIPNNEPALNGEWRKGPWESFFELVSQDVSMSRLLAEDLGVVLSETDQILDKYDIPGMKVLQQRIPSNDGENDEIHPHQWSKNVIGYTGTHDSPTIKEWFEEANSTQIESFKEYKSKLNQSFNDDIWDFISLVWESPSLLAVTTVQDLLKLDKTARFNIPGTQENNWSWRLNNLKDLESTIENLKSLNESNSRII